MGRARTRRRAARAAPAAAQQGNARREGVYACDIQMVILPYEMKTKQRQNHKNVIDRFKELLHYVTF